MILRKSVIDWPEYSIDSLGNVRRNNAPVQAFLNNHGYLCFNAVDKTRRKQLRIHREVARAFIGDRTGIVRHIDGNKLNCALSNLAWGTCKDNEADKRRHGRMMIGELHHQAKLTQQQVDEIRLSNSTTRELADAHGVTYHQIWAIRKGISWRSL